MSNIEKHYKFERVNNPKYYKCWLVWKHDFYMGRILQYNAKRMYIFTLFDSFDRVAAEQIIGKTFKSMKKQIIWYINREFEEVYEGDE